jgi:hypothetical protein
MGRCLIQFTHCQAAQVYDPGLAQHLWDRRAALRLVMPATLSDLPSVPPKQQVARSTRARGAHPLLRARRVRSLLAMLSLAGFSSARMSLLVSTIRPTNS